MGELPPAGAVSGETTDYSLFEGMFRRALRVEPDSAEADALREIGFDLRAPKGRYPGEVWRAALDVAARHRFPDRSPEEGHRELGRLFISGFFETIVGKVIGSILPFLGTDRMMWRVPKFTSMATAGLVVEVAQEAEKRWRIRFGSRTASGDFTAGAVEGAVARTGGRATVELQNRSPEGFELVVTQLT